jgi:hypothetical protein
MPHCGGMRYSSGCVGLTSSLVGGFPSCSALGTRMKHRLGYRRVTYGTEGRVGLLGYAGCVLGPRLSVRSRAAGGDDVPKTDEEEEEARLEAFEARLRSSSSASASVNRQKKNASGSDMQQQRGRAEWKKGELFPEGWEEMDPIEKATEIYLGERGILYWSTQLTIWGLVLLVVVWVGFRLLYGL